MGVRKKNAPGAKHHPLDDTPAGECIEARNLIKSFGDPPVNVLKSVSLKIGRGEFVSIIGRSGSGKSTLLYMLSGLDTPSSGEVLIEGKNINAMPRTEFNYLRNRTIGFVFQFHYLLPELTLLENALMPARKYGDHRARETYAKELLAAFGLGDKFGRYPSQVSGGESQRAAVARALVMEPRYLFADEPTGNLDTVNGDIVMDLFQKINRDFGAAIIMVTHDPDFAEMARRKIHIVDGALAD